MTCLTCTHRNPGKMDPHGFNACTFHARWTFFPHQHTCDRYRNIAETRDLTISRATMPTEPTKQATGGPE
jgi:hypothetical protein